MFVFGLVTGSPLLVVYIAALFGVVSFRFDPYEMRQTERFGDFASERL